MIISISGADGSGKSTLSKLLSHNISGAMLSKVGATNRGRVLAAKLIAQETGSEKEALIYNDFLVQLVDELVNFKQDDRTKICDRYIFDFIVNQRFFGNHNKEVETFLLNNYMPDYAIFIDTDPSICEQRLNQRGDRTSLESLHFLKFATKEFRRLAEVVPNSIVLNGNLSRTKIGGVLQEKLHSDSAINWRI